MPSKSTVVNDCGITFCTAVQKCEFKNCRKNGTHHLQISSSFSSETGQDLQESYHRWYCDRHFKLLVPNQNAV